MPEDWQSLPILGSPLFLFGLLSSHEPGRAALPRRLERVAEQQLSPTAERGWVMERSIDVQEKANPFPLTPALSLRERENNIRQWDRSVRVSSGLRCECREGAGATRDSHVFQRPGRLFPLPGGEGQGEGERVTSSCFP
jgi:hypothetical protein